MQHNVILDPNDPADYVGKCLSDDDKFKVLTSRVEFPDNFNFLVTFGRRFNPIWMARRPWLRYSINHDRACCNSCLCFHELGASLFVSTGFRNWKKASGRKDSYLVQHKRSKDHKLVEEKAFGFLKARRPGSGITAKLQKQIAEEQIRTT